MFAIGYISSLAASLRKWHQNQDVIASEYVFERQIQAVFGEYRDNLIEIQTNIRNNQFDVSQINDQEEIIKAISTLPLFAESVIEHAIKFKNKDALNAALNAPDIRFDDNQHSTTLRMKHAVITAAFHRDFEMLDTILDHYAKIGLPVPMYEIFVPKDNEEWQISYDAHLKIYPGNRTFVMRDFFLRIPNMAHDEDMTKAVNSKIAAISELSNTLYGPYGVIEIQHKLADFLLIQHPVKAHGQNHNTYMQMGKTFLSHTIKHIAEQEKELDKHNIGDDMPSSISQLPIHDIVRNFLRSKPIEDAIGSKVGLG